MLLLLFFCCSVLFVIFVALRFWYLLCVTRAFRVWLPLQCAVYSQFEHQKLISLVLLQEPTRRRENDRFWGGDDRNWAISKIFLHFNGIASMIPATYVWCSICDETVRCYQGHQWNGTLGRCLFLPTLQAYIQQTHRAAKAIDWFSLSYSRTISKWRIQMHW